MSGPTSASSDSAPYAVPSDVVARKVGDTTVLVRLSTNRIYELNASGARIWELVGQQMARDQILTTLIEEFDVEPDVLTREFDALIASLRAEGLV
jgi:hypothetical protein